MGRGLSSLIPNKSFGFVKPAQNDTDASINQGRKEDGAILELNPDDIAANPYQPRTAFEEEKLRELADSIRAHGILNPLVVVQRADGRYELIAGERRLRAARDIGLPRVPAIVRVADHKQQLELSLIENIQREDLNPIERASGYERLMREFSLTQEEAARVLGKSRSVIANTIRLLRLPEEIKDSLHRGEISEGHAKIILGLNDSAAKISLWKQITGGRLPVRAAETYARQMAVRAHTRRAGAALSPELKSMQEEMESKLGTRVVIKGTPDRGQVVIEYFTREELDKIRRQLFDGSSSI